MLERGIELYRGPLLPSDIYQDWTETHRQTYRDMFLDMLLRWLGYCSSRRVSQGPDTAQEGIGEIASVRISTYWDWRSLQRKIT